VLECTEELYQNTRTAPRHPSRADRLGRVAEASRQLFRCTIPSHHCLLVPKALWALCTLYLQRNNEPSLYDRDIRLSQVKLGSVTELVAEDIVKRYILFVWRTDREPRNHTGCRLCTLLPLPLPLPLPIYDNVQCIMR